MKMWIEDFQRDPKTGVCDAFIDFRNEREFKKFCKPHGYPETMPSMIHLKNFTTTRNWGSQHCHEIDMTGMVFTQVLDSYVAGLEVDLGGQLLL